MSGLYICRGQPADGWRLDPTGLDSEGFHHYRALADARAEHWPATGPTWQCRAEGFARQLSSRSRHVLAESLGLPVAVLDLLPLLGWNGDEPRGGCWTFPECDGRGEVIGIVRRFRDGSKRSMNGSRRGLTLVEGWRDRPGAVYIVEGASDTLALAAAGLCVVGRPSAMGGVDHLVELLRDWPADRDIIVIGENDRRKVNFNGNGRHHGNLN